MFLERLRVAMFALVAGLILATGVGVLGGRAGGASSARGVNATTGPETTERKEPVPDQAAPDDRSRAQRLALAAHEQAAAFGKLPRFSYQVRYRWGVVDSMRAVDATVDRLKQSLSAPVIEKDWIGWYQTAFSWDEQHFVWEMSPGDTRLNYDARFWTNVDAWERHEASDRSSVNFVRSAGPEKFWRSLTFFDFSYLRLTPHRYWWGRTMNVNGQTMNLVPPERATWRLLGAEKFGDEECDLVDSPERGQRLWIGRGSRRVRGALAYRVQEDQSSRGFYNSEPVRRIAGRAFDSQRDYSRWWSREANEDQLTEIAIAYADGRAGADPSRIQPNELVRFDDYREVAPGVWLPFRETRAFPHASKTVPGKRLLNRSELRVYRVATDVDLSDRIARLMPREGDPIQDQRYAVPVDFKFRADRTDQEVRELAGAEYRKRLEGTEVVKRLVEPIAALVGRPAPALPATGWIGDHPADLTGRPYLLHFWATWCGPCKADLPRLNSLSKAGVAVLGAHPAGTSREEVEKFIRDQRLVYPTFLDPGKKDEAVVKKVGGYPVGLFPYCILVDAQGRVAGHGSLSECLERFGTESLRGTPVPASPAAKR